MAPPQLIIYEEIEAKAREAHAQITLDEKYKTLYEKSRAFTKYLDNVRITTITPFKFLLNFQNAVNISWKSEDVVVDPEYGNGYLALDTLLRRVVEGLTQDRYDAMIALEGVIAKAEKQLLWAEEKGYYKRRRIIITTTSSSSSSSAQ
jgi:hypothetical protein